jgi:uncharacterized protein (TIGR02679 family)
MSRPAAATALRLRGEGFGRLWAQARAALERNGLRVDGTSVGLPDPTDAERAAIGALLGRHRRPAQTMRVDLGAVHAALVASPLGMGLLEWLESEGGRLIDRRAQAAADRSWDAAVWEVALGHTLADEPWFGDWVDGLRTDGLLKRLAPGSEDELLDDACAVLARLPVERPTALAILAGELTGDTKRLTDTGLATVVLRALAHRAGVERPRTASQRRALWVRFGVVDDDLSSHVLVLNLPGRGCDFLASWLADAAVFGEPFRITLRQLMNATELEVEPAVVRVCENPAILLEAANRLGDQASPLVCTEGQPSEACRVLLRQLAAHGCCIEAHADFDWDGLRIVGGLVADGATPWRFRATDYASAAERLGDRCEKLSGPAVETPWEPELAELLAAQRQRIFEEQVVDDLLADLSTPR